MELEIENFRVKETRRQLYFWVRDYKNVSRMSEKMVKKYFRPGRIWPGKYTDFLDNCLHWNFNLAIVKKIIEVEKIKKIVIIIDHNNSFGGVGFFEIRSELNIKTEKKNKFIPLAWYKYESLDEFRNTFLSTFKNNCSLLGMKYFDEDEDHLVTATWKKKWFR